MNRPGSDQDLVDAIERLRDRILARVVLTETCWAWTGATTRNGYGQVTLSPKQHGGTGTRTVRAHRAVWMLHRGAIAAGHELDHLCKTRDCVNPAHLETVTPAENIRRANRRRGASIRVRPNSDGSVSYAVLFREGDAGVLRQRSRTFPTQQQAEAFRTTLLAA